MNISKAMLFHNFGVIKNNVRVMPFGNMQFTTRLQNWNDVFLR